MSKFFAKEASCEVVHLPEAVQTKYLSRAEW
jgi:hypothetical protein